MRQVASRYSLVTCLLLAGLALLLIISHEQGGSREELTAIAPRSVSGRSPASTVHQERTNIFFLKAHKCASSTVQNILLRFGLERGLSFVLPTLNNYIGNPEMFSATMIDELYATQNRKYNIFAHHSRYSSEEVRSIMYEDTVYVTILRHPADVYESIFSYYKFQKMYNVTFEELLKTPNSVKKINRRYFKRIGFNQMSWDLGFLEEDFNSTSKVDEFISKIDVEFDLVMMSDWMEASLVLLADLMNWPLEKVVSLKLNSRTADNIYKMSDFERSRVVELNHVDYKLYTHFLNKFRKRIIDYGEEIMRKDIERLLSLNDDLQFKCVQSLNTKGFGRTQAYKLRDEGNKLCFFAARGELAFTEYLRQVQKQKVKVLSNLQMLLDD
ncbi:galactosylceramide sulfotransferase-like isoform X2 [Macrosteles quadrilineatus]|uniref:galactosylceramide sulfotransferase-like isoform X2 n=1 Tax=Macrosteles quadrilineatus TaxID=74068 RepID=UPI0023E2651F|nr:galactosylceramide sulfotransferase-like isoform X2 [Macrosteles quadrilineatus]